MDHQQTNKPPKESCKSRVSLESRYGMCFCLPSTSAEMTLPVGRKTINTHVGQHPPRLLTQSRKGQVDLGRLFQPFSHSTRLALPFAPGQIDQIQLSASYFAFDLRAGHSFDVDGEDGVTARRVGVHHGRSDRSILPASFHQLFALVNVVDGVFGQFVNVNARFRMFFQLESALVVVSQQVANFFIVDFEVGGVDEKLATLGDGNRFENVFKGPVFGNKVSTHWRKRTRTVVVYLGMIPR